MTQKREKWDSLLLSRAGFCMIERSMVFRVSDVLFIYSFVLFRSSGKKEHLDNDYEAHSRRHLKDALQLKILWTRINIYADSFLDKYHEMKMGEDAVEIISCTKI